MNWLCEMRDKYFGEASQMAFKIVQICGKSNNKNVMREVQKLKDLI